MRQLGCAAGFQWDYVFDWTIMKYQQSAAAAMARQTQAQVRLAPPGTLLCTTAFVQEPEQAQRLPGRSGSHVHQWLSSPRWAA